MDELSDEVAAHYSTGYEAERLAGPRLERLRTEELLLRFLPPPPARLIDIGGGPGRYAAWLVQLGYDVDLVDAMPLHVEQAEALAASLDRPFTAVLGDARNLTAADASYDAALLLGPLYHLTDRDDRVRAVTEARRVSKPGGVVIAAAISRFASLLDGLRQGFLADPRFQAIVRADLATGQHRNPTDDPAWFTTAYFHRPADLEAEFAEAGLVDVSVLGIEGPAWYLPDLDHGKSELALLAARSVESDPDLRAASSHLMATGRVRA